VERDLEHRHRGETSPDQADQTRRYKIQITDVATKRDVVLTFVDLTDEEKRVVVS